jgi:hypothetical protein
MIENEKQYKVTKTRIQEVEAILLKKKQQDITDLKIEAAIASLMQIKNQMESEIEDYEKSIFSHPHI